MKREYEFGGRIPYLLGQGRASASGACGRVFFRHERRMTHRPEDVRSLCVGGEASDHHQTSRACFSGQGLLFTLLPARN